MLQGLINYLKQSDFKGAKFIQEPEPSYLNFEP